MSDANNELAVPEARLAEADQALLLARIVGSVAAFACMAWGEIAVLNLARSQSFFAELGADSELPTLTQAMFSARNAILLGLPVLFLVTLYFLWSRGKMAAWMAGLGLLLMVICAPLAHWAATLPLIKVMEEMGSM
jgi:hypothetical protein